MNRALHIVALLSLSGVISGAGLVVENVESGSGIPSSPGLLLSGGDVPAFLTTSSAVHFLESAGLLSDRVTVSSVSGGTLGYAAQESGNLGYPNLDEAAEWSMYNLSSWGPSNTGEYAFYAAGGALDPSGIQECIESLITDGKPSTTCQQYAGFSTIIPCLKDVLHFRKVVPIWYCVVEYLAGSVGISVDDITAGPRPWHIGYSVFDRSATPLGSNGHQPVASILESQLSYTSMLIQDGHEAQFIDSPNFASTGTRGFRNLFFSNLPLTLDFALTYSSNYLIIPLQWKDGDGNRCGSMSPELGAALTYGNGVNGRWGRGRFINGLALDGGAIDQFGFIPVLRQQLPTIVAIYASPSHPSYTTLPNLFGVDSSSRQDPFDCGGDGSTSLIGTRMQVFHEDLWPQLLEHMVSTNNTGVYVAHDVEVLRNDALGIKPYILDTLVVVDNQRKTAFEETVLGATNITELESYGYPTGSGLIVKKEVAVAMSLLVEWKLGQNVDVISQALNIN